MFLSISIYWFLWCFCKKWTYILGVIYSNLYYLHITDRIRRQRNPNRCFQQNNIFLFETICKFAIIRIDTKNYSEVMILEECYYHRLTIMTKLLLFFYFYKKTIYSIRPNFSSSCWQKGHYHKNATSTLRFYHVSVLKCKNSLYFFPGHILSWNHIPIYAYLTELRTFHLIIVTVSVWVYL